MENTKENVSRILGWRPFPRNSLVKVKAPFMVRALESDIHVTKITTETIFRIVKIPPTWDSKVYIVDVVFSDNDRLRGMRLNISEDAFVEAHES